jgi:hypothetical protein
MQEKNDNSGKERIDLQGWEPRVQTNVKSVGQECPTHTSNCKVKGVGPFGRGGFVVCGSDRDGGGVGRAVVQSAVEESAIRKIQRGIGACWIVRGRGVDVGIFQCSAGARK